MEHTHRAPVEDALIDVMDGRVAAHPLDDAPVAPALARRHHLTESFHHKWTHTRLTEEQRTTFAAVMRGVENEPRHPAFRVENTPYKGVLSAQAGTQGTLYFKPQGDRLIWLYFATT